MTIRYYFEVAPPYFFVVELIVFQMEPYTKLYIKEVLFKFSRNWHSDFMPNIIFSWTENERNLEIRSNVTSKSVFSHKLAGYNNSISLYTFIEVPVVTHYYISLFNVLSKDYRYYHLYVIAQFHFLLSYY